MQHLFSSRVRVERPTTTKSASGRSRASWEAVSGLESVACRLDLQFVRPNDIQPAIVAGKAPDRYGILFCASGTPMKAGDRIVTTSGPVTGTFEIRTIPDAAVGFSAAHHIEVQIWETNRDLDALWPKTDAS